MKAVLAALSSVIVVAIPGLAHAGEDGLNASLASATARAMNVAPWVKVSVVKVVAEDQLSWLARSSGRLTSFQFARSVEWCIWTPGYHSKVEVAM